MKKIKSTVRIADRTVSWRSSEPLKLCPTIAVISSSLLLPIIFLLSFRHSFSFLSFDQSGPFNLQMKVVGEENGEIFQLQSTKLDDRQKIEKHLNSTETGRRISSTTTVLCDTSHERFDTCLLQGDVRIISKSSKIIVINNNSSSPNLPNNSWKIRPYPRKWEAPLMNRITQLSIFPHSDPPAARCTANHSAPAIVFSSGGFSGNFYHDVTDILVPLYVTSHAFHREVHFVLSDYNAKFVGKYRRLLAGMSRYEVLGLEGGAGDVHCFSEVHVGLVNNKELGIDTTLPPSNPSMSSFRGLLRSSFSLKRNKVAEKRPRKPKLMLQLRKGSRELINSREVISMSKKLGFKVVVSGPEQTKNITSYSLSINSVDALLGVHGAGLTNMLFLPDGAAMIQVVPWGGLKWACRFSYGDPAAGMGLKYFEYEITAEESTLIEQYPRNHTVFTDPGAIHRRGWDALWYVFLEKQKVRVDVKRLRIVLAQVMRYLKVGEE